MDSDALLGDPESPFRVKAESVKTGSDSIQSIRRDNREFAIIEAMESSSCPYPKDSILIFNNGGNGTTSESQRIIWVGGVTSDTVAFEAIERLRRAHPNPSLSVSINSLNRAIAQSERIIRIVLIGDKFRWM